MKNKKIISLAALALTASLFLGACGGNKEEKTTEASSSKTSQVKQTSSSSKKKVITSKDPIASSSSASKSEESHTVGSKNNQAVASQTPAPAKEATPAAPVTKETKEVATPATPAKEKLPSLEEGHAKKQASATENAQYKGVYSVAAGDFSAAAGNWSDKRDTGVTIGQGGQVTIQLPGGQPVAYGISGYNYTLDDGHYHANLSAGDGSAATLDIVVGKDGSVSSVTVLKDGVSHALTRE